MRLLYTLIIIFFWFNHSLGQIIIQDNFGKEYSYTIVEDSLLDTLIVDTLPQIELETQIIDIETFKDTLYIYKIDIIRDLRCLLIGCITEHYEGIEYREFYLIRDNKLIYQRREYPEFKEKIIKTRTRW